MAKTIILAAQFSASPERLFDMYVDPGIHGAFTGAPVILEPRPGGAFRAFEGKIFGTILHVEPKRLLVQTWRAAHWSQGDIDSILVLSFWEEEEGGRIELVHINVADHDFAGVSQGWEKYYWTPWREYLLKSPKSV